MSSPKRDRDDRTLRSVCTAKAVNRPINKMDKTQVAVSVPNTPSKLSQLSMECQTGPVPLPVSWPKPPRMGTLDTPDLAPHSPPVSMMELPRMISEVGLELASVESLWMKGPSMMPAVLGADIPIRAEQSSCEDSSDINQNLDKSLADEEADKPVCSDQGTETTAGKGSKLKSKPLTGVEAVEILAKKRHLGELQFYHFHKVKSVNFRPYDLQVVPSNKTGTDYYIFSPYTVMHIQDGCSTTVMSLAEWYREATLWRNLRDIPFFRDYLLRKAFSGWQRNVRQVIFQRRANLLQERLPIAVPHFRATLLQMSRLIEELKGIHWLPQDVSKKYTLVDFQVALNDKNQVSQGLLEKFLLYRAMILRKVHEDSYAAHQELQLHIKQCQPDQRSQPLHQRLEHHNSLERDLANAESILQRLGNMASLLDCMIVQSLVTIIHREVTSFLQTVLKREKPEQVSLFQTELIFGSDDRLTMFPPLHLFKDVLRGAVLSVAESIMQTFDYCSHPSDGVLAGSTLTTAVAGLTPNVSLSHTAGETFTSALEPNISVLTGVSNPDSKRDTCVLDSKFVMPHQPSLMLRGQRLRGHYYPLSKKQLEWYLGLSATVEEVEREQAKIIQDAQEEVQNLCKNFFWLVEIHLFTSSWNAASLNSMRGWNSLQYEEHIQKIRFWIDKVHTLPPFFTTSNKLFTVNCLQIQSKIGSLLNSIEEDFLSLITEEIQLRSKNLISELKGVVDGLRAQPTDFNDFTHFAIMVDRCKKMSDDAQPQLEYIHSLQETLSRNFRHITPDEVALEEQMLDLWDQFVFQLKQAEETVSHCLPAMTKTLNNSFQSLKQELEDLVSGATSTGYLDPKQNAAQVVSKLKATCKQLHVISVRLKELSRTKKTLKEEPLDLTFVEVALRKIYTRKELWELLTVCKSQIQEWMQLLFCKFVVAKAQEKVEEWHRQAMALSKVIPSEDAVLQGALSIMEDFGQQLPVLAELSSPTLKHKHWRNIFKAMGLLYAPTWNPTVADLVSKKLLEHQKAIKKVCRDAKAEADMEQVFRKIQRRWEGAHFQLAKFIITVWEDKAQMGNTRKKRPIAQQCCDSGTFTIIGLDTLLSETEDSVMTLSNMLVSPHVADFRQDIEFWVHLLQELEELLHFCEMYQEKWVFLSKMFYEALVKNQSSELLEKFQPVDTIFREMIQIILHNPRVLNIVQHLKNVDSDCPYQGNSLRELITDGLSTMNKISSEVIYHLDAPRRAFPRLCFLSDDEVIKLLSLHPTPITLLPVVRKCFHSVRWLEVESKTDKPTEQNAMSSGMDISESQIWVNGVYGPLREYVPLISPLEPSLYPLAWFGTLEQKLKQAMVQQMMKCATAHQMSILTVPDGECHRKISETLLISPTHHSTSGGFAENEGPTVMNDFSMMATLSDMLSQFPLQCLLVSEEAGWCTDVQKTFQNTSRVNWECIKARYALKLKIFCRAIQDGIMDSCERTHKFRHKMTSLRALVLLNMKHSRQLSQLMQVKDDYESSFVWQRLMKYHLDLHTNQKSKESPLGIQEGNYDDAKACSVEVLGNKIPYGYEYIGPENWMMVSTPSTDRTVLGILLAVTNYRCGFLSGPCMSGKSKTVVHIGHALGQQVVTLKCHTSTHPSVVQRMLLGALQTGSWLVLESIDSLTQGSLSALGQHLSDIRESLSSLLFKTQSYEDSEPWSNDRVKDTVGEMLRKPDVLEGQMVFTGKRILARFSYGCVAISSNSYLVKMPENLRIATRPISLAVPDYTIIMEVLFTSQGFTDATSISRRLMSLFNIAKDSHCLPDIVSGQTSLLALFKSIIAASSSNLHKSKIEELRKDSALTEDVQGVLKPMNELEGIVKSQTSRFNKSSALLNSLAEEQALVKGIISVSIPAFSDPQKSSQFCKILEELFPTAQTLQVLQQFNEEKEQFNLKIALTEELQKTGLHTDSGVISSALTLFQSLKLSQAVLMVGPAGSGKTTCYQTLAGALRKLASSVVEVDEDNPNEGETTTSEHQVSPFAGWYSVYTVVLFPNALLHEEIFGTCSEQECIWQDGAVTKVLRDSERHDLSANPFFKLGKRRALVQKMKWLVLDGDPLATPGWLDKLSTLGKSQPFLSLSSGEKVWPSREEMRVLAEVTDISGASPSAVTQCCLVYFSGKELWKSVWKTEMEVLYREHTLEHRALNMWESMATDLFARTLTFIKQNALTSVMLTEESSARKSGHGVTDGLQEVMSFIRILHALLEHSRRGCGMKASPNTEKQDALAASISTEIWVRNMFVVAYIWGFGGHLHQRHWTQFSHFARESLYESRYKVEFPKEGSVFDHCFNLSEGVSTETSCNPCLGIGKSLPLRANIPQYERHACLLELLVDANQPAILVGETASGKTTLCQSILSQGRPHIRVPASPLLHVPDLRRVLENMRCQQLSMENMGKMKNQSGMLLFIDDLHEAPLDASGKESRALEMLRQCISRRGFLSSDGYHFKLFRSGAVCYLGTCGIPGKGRSSGNRISPRLSRQFSIIALPSLDVDILFSFHSSDLQNWLSAFAPRPSDMAKCIISATHNLYQAVCKNFCLQTNRPFIFFSVHDLQKVFQGMFLWNMRTTTQSYSLQADLPSSALPLFSPAVLGPAAGVLNIARVWMHECLRTFGDRLGSEEDIQTFFRLLADVSEVHFGKRLAVEPYTDKQETPRSTCPSQNAGSAMTSSTDLKLKETVGGSSLIKSLNKITLSEKVAHKEKSLFSSSDSGSGSEEDVSGEKSVKSKRLRSSKRRRTVERGSKTDELSAKSEAQSDLMNTKPEAPKLAVLRLLKSPVLKKIKKNEKLDKQDLGSHGATTADLVPPIQLLKDMVATIQSAVFGPEPPSSLTQQHNFKRNSVYKERNLHILTQQFALTVKTREEDEETVGNDQWARTSSYAVHKERVRQLSHLLRVLLIPGGHGALFCTARGTGRKTTVRLAALLSGYKLMEVHRGNEDKFREMLRDAGSLTGMQGIKIIFLVHENISLSIMDELLMVMASGTVPDLYSEEDRKNLIQRIITTGNSSRSRLRDDQALDKYFRNIQRNLHVFLLLPLINDVADRSVRHKVLSAHIKKALSLCHCVEIYSPWTSQALVEIACHQLKQNCPQNADTEVDRDSLITSLSWAMACIHQTAIKYSASYLPDIQPFTSQTYVELIAHYLQLCSHMFNQCQGHTNRMVSILSRVRDIADTAQQSRQQVVSLKEKLRGMQKVHALLLQSQETELTLCTRTHWHSLMEKNRLAQLEEQAYEATMQVEDAFKQVSQLYKKAVSALKSLSQVDLDEVRRYRCPPEGVVLVMDAICMLFNRPRNWESSKKLLGQPHFFQDLEFYDRSSINEELYKKLCSIVSMPEFQPESVRSKSRACESLCHWIRALYEHAHVLRHIAPQEARQKDLEACVSESRKRMQEACLQEELARERYEETQRKIEANRQGMEDVSAQVRLMDVQEREATNTLQQIGYHITLWNNRKKEMQMSNQTIPGDALILAAIVTYFGPFGPDVRMQLLEEWQELCLHGQAKSKLKDPRATDAVKICLDIPPSFSVLMDMHLQKALARTIGAEQCVDTSVSPGSVLKLLLWFYRGTWAPRWPLLVDIQQHEDFRSQHMGVKGKVTVENEHGTVVSADDPELMDKLSHAAEKGLKVMVSHIERLKPNSEFLEFLVRPSGSHAPGFIRPVRSSHPDFCLFFSTPLSVRALQREIHPAVLKEVQVIDLSLSSVELKELMLSEILQSENPDLWSQHFQMRRDKQSLEDKLYQEKASLMDYVLQSLTPLQQDLGFLPRVSACQKASQKLQKDIDQCCQELEGHKPLLKHYSFVTDLATAFYQVLQQVALLSPFYLFTLNNFLIALHHALLSKGQPNVLSNSEGSVMTKVTMRIVVQLMAQYRPCMFQSHVSLLRLLVSVALFRHSEDYTKEEQEAFLHGLSDPQQVTTDHAPSLKLPNWIPSSVHAELVQLEKIAPFRGLIDSLRVNADQWQEYLTFPSSTVIGPIPCQSHSHLSIIQRALLWKTLFPNWLAAVAEDLAACQLGQSVHSAPQVGSARAPHTGCPEALARYLNKSDGPVIVQLPPPSQGVSASAHPIHWLNQIAQITGDKRVVKIISLGTSHEKDLILRELDQGIQKGHWVVLNNCHLVKEWDEEVVSKLTYILSLAAKGPKVEVDKTVPFPVNQVHPLFRVWFITQGEDPHSVPAVARLCALRLVCDSPWDLKEQLCSSLSCVASRLAFCTSTHSTIFMEPILRCVTLHSVLLHRQSFLYLGQGSLYHWTQEDLVTLIEAHIHLSKFCSDTTEALEYIAGYLVYGGHVSDSTDLEAVVGVTRACLRPPSAMWGSGPHTLAHIISTSGHLGFQGLDHHVQNLRDTNDPLLLGFSSGLAVEQVKLHSLSLHTLLHLSQSRLGGTRPLASVQRHQTSLPDYKEAHTKLAATQYSLQHTADGKPLGVGIGPPGPVHDFLLMERDKLSEHVASLLASLSSHSFKMASSWTECTVQALSTLEKRAKLLQGYLGEDWTSSTFFVCCLSAFENPQGFLAALIRQTAHDKQRDVSEVHLQYQVLSIFASPSSLPNHRVYLGGLELHGAVWVSKYGAIQDTLSHKPCRLPLVAVSGIDRTSIPVVSPFPSAQGSASAFPVYNCPLYRDPQLTDGNWSLSENNIITHIPLVTKIDPVLCAQKRVRLSCML